MQINGRSLHIPTPPLFWISSINGNPVTDAALLFLFCSMEVGEVIDINADAILQMMQLLLSNRKDNDMQIAHVQTHVRAEMDAITLYYTDF